MPRTPQKNEIFQTLRSQLHMMRKAGLPVIYHPSKVGDTALERATACLRAAVAVVSHQSLDEQHLESALVLFFHEDHDENSTEAAYQAVRDTVVADVIEEARELYYLVGGNQSSVAEQRSRV